MQRVLVLRTLDRVRDRRGQEPQIEDVRHTAYPEARPWLVGGISRFSDVVLVSRLDRVWRIGRVNEEHAQKWDRVLRDGDVSLGERELEVDKEPSRSLFRDAVRLGGAQRVHNDLTARELEKRSRRCTSSRVR